MRQCPASRGGLTIHPQYLEMVFVTVLHVERRACGTLGWLRENIHKSGQFRFTIRSCQTARSFLLPSSHYQVGTVPLMTGVAPATGPVLFGGGVQVIRGFSVISGKKTKKIGGFDQHDWWKIRVNLLPW